MLVYDVSNRESFEALPKWFSELETYVSPSVVKILVGECWPVFRVVVRDDRLQRAEELHADSTRWCGGEEGENGLLERGLVGRRDGCTIRSAGVKLGEGVAILDAVLDPDSYCLTRRSEEGGKWTRCGIKFNTHGSTDPSSALKICSNTVITPS